MDKKACKFCGENLEMENPKFILQELAQIGYSSSDFCKDECLIRYIAKKFKKKINKMIKNG